MVKKVTFVGFREAIAAPMDPLLVSTSDKSFQQQLKYPFVNTKSFSIVTFKQPLQDRQQMTSKGGVNEKYNPTVTFRE